MFNKFGYLFIEKIFFLVNGNRDNIIYRGGKMKEWKWNYYEQGINDYEFVWIKNENFVG